MIADDDRSEVDAPAKKYDRRRRAPSSASLPAAAEADPSRVAYGPYRLLVTEVTDPLSNVVEAVPDYRVLAPWKLTDANGNVSEVRFNALGRARLLAVMGKPGGGEGDTREDPTAERGQGSPPGLCEQGAIVKDSDARSHFENSRPDPERMGHD
ncbi:hypothetical protein WMF26_38065 [Sorangium sp. So ce185]|uniref:hypothetical protein n=1 Tax=Sorangium sp. So ce185 TaxID=3133287 RepID=UPI003F5DE5E9